MCSVSSVSRVMSKKGHDEMSPLDAVLSWHSMQLVTVGRITLDWPLKPSVPPSINGFRLSTFSSSTIPTRVVVLVLVLNLPAIRVDLDSLDAILDETSSDLSLVFSDIGLTEEELAIEVGNVDRVCSTNQHEAEGEVLEDFASEAARSAENGQALNNTFARHKVIWPGTGVGDAMSCTILSDLL
ncbi:hypothetical protein KCU81_g850, partial [Aureobasidium melanogenum]